MPNADITFQCSIQYDNTLAIIMRKKQDPEREGPFLCQHLKTSVQSHAQGCPHFAEAN